VAAIAATLFLKFDQFTASWASEMTEYIWRIGPGQSILRTYTLEEELSSNLRVTRFFSRTIGLFSIFALFLGTSGIYAIVSAMQATRFRETGLRIALGETPLRVGIRLLGFGLRLVAAGAVVGLLLALPLFVSVRSLLFLDGATNVLSVFVLSGLILVLGGVLASIAPAYKAARTNPTAALRLE
jgi:putative ABC transport system permease protein